MSKKPDLASAYQEVPNRVAHQATTYFRGVPSHAHDTTGASAIHGLLVLARSARPPIVRPRENDSMQNSYVGDIGDFVKFAILRELSQGKRLGVGWWLHPDIGPSGDGRHIGYLDDCDGWRHLDPGLFDALKCVVKLGKRQVSALEDAALITGAVYFREEIPVSAPAAARRDKRAAWFARMKEALKGCDLVFLDPDNGLEPSGFSHGAAKAGKCVTLAELEQLREGGRALVVYHHQTRRAGGHHEEIAYWSKRLLGMGFSPVDALRSKSFSPRAFFILGGDDALRQRASVLSQRWGGLLSWHEGVAGGQIPALPSSSS